MPSLTAAQKRRARQKLARTQRVPESTITDDLIQTALSTGLLSASDCGPAGGGGGASYDSGSSSSDSGGYSGGE